jgi:hypothetical protein
MYIPPSSITPFIDGSVVRASDFNDKFTILVAAINDNDSRISTIITALGGGFSVNVKSTTYGAKGDGVTDDTVAIQNAINYAISTGVPVYFPLGYYLVSDSLLVQQNGSYRDAILVGDGNATLKMINSSKPTIDVKPSTSLFAISGINFKYDGTNIVAGAGTDNNSHIYIDNTSYYLNTAIIDNCYFDTTQAGLNTGNNYVYAINTYSVSDMTIKDCVFASYTECAIKLRRSSNVKIKRNYFMTCRIATIGMYTASLNGITPPTPAGMYYYDTTGDSSCYNNLVENNTFFLGGWAGYAISGFRTVGLRVLNNEFYVDCGADTTAGVLGYSVISLYGVINGSSTTPVVVYRDYCQGTQIIGNKFFNDLGYSSTNPSTRGAMALTNQIDATVSNNTLLDMGSSTVFNVPMDIRYSYSVVVSDNHITRCRSINAAIYFNTVVGITIRGNVFTDAIYGATSLVSVLEYADRGTISDPFSVGVFTGNVVTYTNSTYKYTVIYTSANGSYMTNSQFYVRSFGNQVIGGTQAGYQTGRVFDEIDDVQVLTWMGVV